jgi:hypothetical protein
MNEVKVKKVSPDKSRVTIQVMNDIELVFCRIDNSGKKIEIVSKCKLDAQVYDPDACRVPANLFNQACRQAAAILLEPTASKPNPSPSQIVLFDEVPA